jgi:hypothetical protein
LFVHDSVSPIVGHFDGTENIGLLRVFVAPDQEYEHHRPTPHAIHPVAGAVVDAHLGNAFAYRLDITRMTLRKTSRALMRAIARRSRKPQSQRLKVSLWMISIMPIL